MQEVCVAAWQRSRAAVLEVMACPQEKDLTLGYAPTSPIVGEQKETYQYTITSNQCLIHT